MEHKLIADPPVTSTEAKRPREFSITLTLIGSSFALKRSKVRSWLTAVVCRQPLSDRKINPDVYTTVLPPMEAKDPRGGGN